MADPWRRDPIQYLLFALLASFAVWYINFYRTLSPDLQPDILPLGSQLHPDPGGLHIVVTGGAGFIGSHAALALSEAGHAVTVIDNLSRGNAGAVRALRDLIPARQFRFLRLDLGERAALCDALAGLSPRVDLVMHFAAVAYVGESMRDPLQYYKNVTVNTVNLLDCMAANDIRQLVYSSTCAVYGNPEKLPVTELTPPLPINPYGQSKLMAEEVIRWYARSQPAFRAIILRYFNVYGSDPLGRLGEYPRPELRSQSRISGACLDAALALVDNLTVLGTRHPTEDGTCVRDYIHVSDLISAHRVAVGHVANPPRLYNIGTGVGVSVKQFVEACRRVTQRDIKVVYRDEARPGDYAAVWSDVAKIRQELGWRANYTNIEEGLRHAWQWRMRHPNGY